ncbi:hypothetical protein E1B28_008254 [Marasmius oreades]|uniref:Uncharacterized protein n=1 Tax=Marasmius oreades TaxID=181124 RepID=A0A9P7RYP0_9AGAR|nr:uncharacterized protein E1B28_008254 [Marasmius oreades]KAG7091852.1 hypothetical protein E1B28_008254 [Marasmius oreades]
MSTNLNQKLELEQTSHPKTKETRGPTAPSGGNEAQWNIVSYKRHHRFENHRSQTVRSDSSSNVPSIYGAGTNTHGGSGGGSRGRRSRGRATGEHAGTGSVNVSTFRASSPSVSAVGSGQS